METNIQQQTRHYTDSCDIAVVGGGHAGAEAALAAARMGLSVICFAISLDSIGNMPCNPAIGGSGKGHLVRELDALGGEMPKTADKTCIQYRMLGVGKGPAVHSLRAQADRRRYAETMKLTLETQQNLRVKQAEIVEVGVETSAANGDSEPDGHAPPRAAFVRTSLGAVYYCRAVVLCAGTYLRGRTITGELAVPGGPDGFAPAYPLSASLAALGLSLRRFKTGTPPRVDANTVDFAKMLLQEGDANPTPFSFETTEPPANRAVCHLTYTNEHTHEIIRRNLSRSPLYSGVIEGTGPRYCPSIEDKIVRFPDKARHQLFIEPMGLSTRELYVQGFSSSLPEDAQIAALRSVAGLEQAEVTRPAYAIEYDCLDPTELYPTLECKKISGLYAGGQLCGSSGYEEAAVQGFCAGVNAALKLKGEPPMVLSRTDGYIGTLIDDLVTKGTDEPYRMMTSRCEYRLLHRQDNADLRLSRIGHRLGLVSDERVASVNAKYSAAAKELERLERTHIPPSEELNALLSNIGEIPPESGVSLSALLRRPRVTYAMLAPLDPGRAEREPLPGAVVEQVELQLKYGGYIKRQLRQAEEMRRMEEHKLGADFDYDAVPGLRTEARQKLKRVKPLNFGQASRISGVSPADMTALMIFMKKCQD